MSRAVITEEQKQKLIEEFAGSKRGGWSTGHQLPEITKKLVELYGDAKVKIILPYHGFHCYGSARKVNEDVTGTMPFAKPQKEIEETSTLFYPGMQVNKKGIFVPFWADTDCFRIKSIEQNVIELENDISWRAFL